MNLPDPWWRRRNLERARAMARAVRDRRAGAARRVRGWVLTMAALLAAGPAAGQVVTSGAVCTVGGAGGGSLTGGTTPLSGCDGLLLYGTSGALGCESGFGYNATTNATTMPAGVTVTGNNAGATYAADVVVNGTFTGNATGWTLGGGGGAPDWAYASNNVTHASGGGTSALQPSAALTVVASTAYKVCVTISSYTGGTLTPSIGGTSGSALAADGTYCSTLVASNTNNLLMTPTNTFAATVDTITVQAMTAQTASWTLSDGTTPNGFFVGPASQRNWCRGDTTTCQYLGTGSSNNQCDGGLTCVSLTTGTTNKCDGPFACNALNDGSENVCDGIGACFGLKHGDRNVFVGRNSGGNAAIFNVNQTVGVGYTACNILSGDGNVCLGYNTGAVAGAHAYSVALGHGADPTASNQAVIGGDDVAAAGITAMFIGRGVTNTAAPATVTVQPSGGSGSNNAGSAFVLAAGRSTGTAAADLRLQTSPALASGSTAQTLEDRAYVRSKQFTLADNTVATFATITLGDDTAAGGTLDYCVFAEDATNRQMECGAAYVAGVDITAGAGGETCTAPGKAGTTIQAVSAGTLTVTFAATTGTDLCNLRVTADTSLTPTTLWIKWAFSHYAGSAAGRTITPQ